MTMRNKTANIYTEWKPLVDGLSDEVAGKIFKAIFKYQNGEDVDSVNPIWTFIKSKLDEYNKKGENISLSRSDAGKKGMAKRWKNKEKITNITSDNKNNNCYQMITNDNKNNNKIKENKIKEINKENLQKFEEFWQEYKPVPKDDGTIVSKGNKKQAEQKYLALLKSGVKHEDILMGMKGYLENQKKAGWCSCGVPVFLNQEKWASFLNTGKDINNKRIADLTEYDMALMIAASR